MVMGSLGRLWGPFRCSLASLSDLLGIPEPFLTLEPPNEPLWSSFGVFWSPLTLLCLQKPTKTNETPLFWESPQSRSGDAF